ncbi:hypothetical protein VCR4J5_1670003 [Vibrio crassostreae]|uniref:Uncharacterized protein n=1 Tax=Vibrio crassostreae TaxID=246167 RepID=A0ABM9QRW0_9VIBR|nr:hypothetical protein VCRA2113O20_220085 [Vibrio crassostreae]CAK1920045.1 hypothetical protein VCRA2116O31_210105 [Vibrio crassostreae]CAK1940567.1 hypothetical protein VCRA2118O41_250003 [Vibrio crassostreae]CAK1955274.1 hypothetical protein VCRA2117O40_220077 [Vibrio crassostreae]CAK2441607.1 hypothetical protein VCRA2119O52_1980004 [Vibrio crassostreae]
MKLRDLGMKQQDLTDWTSIPAATARQRFPYSRYNKAPTISDQGFI